MSFFFLKLFTFVMFFQPGVVFPALGPFRPYKYTALVALAAYFISGSGSGSSFIANKNTKYFLLFVAMQIMSSASIWIRGGIDTLTVWINFIIIYFLVVKLCTDEKKVRSILLMVLLGITYLSYYSVAKVITEYTPGIRALGFGWYAWPNDLVIILVTVIPLAFCLAETTNRSFIRFLYLSLVALFSLNIMLAGSREGLLGLLVCIGLSLASSEKISRFFKMSISVVLLAATITVGIATVMSREDLSGKLSGDESSSNRLLQWKACIRMVIHHPLLGVGPGEAPSIMDEYDGIRGLMPHNTLAQVFAETGIPGGIFFFLFSCYPLWQAWAFFKRHRDKVLTIPLRIYKYLAISLCGFWSCAILSNRVYFSMLYVLIALIVAVNENMLKPQEAVDD